MKSKLILSLAGLLCSSLSFAATDWAKVRSNPNVAYISQSAYSQAFGGDGFFNACLSDANTFRTIQPLEFCSQYSTTNGGQENGGSEQTCVRTEKRHITLSRNQTESRCSQSVHTGGQENGSEDCVAWTSVSVTLPTTMTFNVYGYTGTRSGSMESSGGPESDTALMFSAPFTVPACK